MEPTKSDCFVGLWVLIFFAGQNKWHLLPSMRIYVHCGLLTGHLGHSLWEKQSHNNTNIDPHFNLFYLLRVSLWHTRDLCEKNTNESHKFRRNMPGAGPVFPFAPFALFPAYIFPFSNYLSQIDVGHRVSNVSNRRIWPRPKDIRQSNQRQVREPTFQLN